MKIFIEKFREWVDIFWKHNLITYDENIYEVILQLHPEITEKYYGRYWYFFDNWLMVKHYDEWYLKNIRSCRINGENAQVVDMYKKLKVYQWNQMKNTDKWDVFFELIISSYYVNRDLYVKYCGEFVDFIQQNVDDINLMDILIKHKDITKENLKFADKDFDVMVEKIINKL